MSRAKGYTPCEHDWCLNDSKTVIEGEWKHPCCGTHDCEEEL